jgi:hypothetical protein
MPARKKPMPAAAKRLRAKSKKERRKRSDPDRRAWADEHDSCAACGFRLGQLGGWLETHEILSGAYGRPYDRRNYLRLCKRFERPGCHDLAHGSSNGWPKLTLENLLWLKRETEIENYDREWLKSIRGTLPKAVRPDQRFIDERGRNLYGY